jgi:hypothetical protein
VKGRAVREGILAVQEANISNQVEQAALFASTAVFVTEPDVEVGLTGPEMDLEPKLERVAMFPSALQGAVCLPFEASDE